MPARRRKPEERQVARARIGTLFAEAERAVGRHPERSRRYVALARRIGMRYQVPLPGALRRLACRRCGEYLHPALGARRRLRSGRLVVTCPGCGRVERIPLKGARREAGIAGRPGAATVARREAGIAGRPGAATAAGRAP